MSNKDTEKTGSGIGIRLRTIRKKLGIRQEELADRAGINRSYISNLENGRSSPTLDVLEKLAKGLGVRLIDFFPGGVVRSSLLEDENSAKQGKDTPFDPIHDEKHFEYDTEEIYNINPGLKDFLFDEDEMLLIQPTPDEVGFLKSIRFGRNFKPDKRLYRDALLAYRRRKKSGL